MTATTMEGRVGPTQLALTGAERRHRRGERRRQRLNSRPRISVQIKTCPPRMRRSVNFLRPKVIPRLSIQMTFTLDSRRSSLPSTRLTSYRIIDPSGLAERSPEECNVNILQLRAGRGSALTHVHVIPTDADCLSLSPINVFVTSA